MSRRHNLRRIRKLQCYSALELAAVLKVNIATIRRWGSEGLEPIERRRPFLYLGQAAADFLAARAQPRQPLAPGELYCTPCKQRRLPVDAVVRLIPRSSTTVDFSGPCPVCGRSLFRLCRIDEISANLGPCRIAYEDDATTVRRDGHCPQTALSRELQS